MKRATAWTAALAAGIILHDHRPASAEIWQYPGCPSVDDEKDFGYDTLVWRGKQPDPTLLEPVKLAVAAGPDGEVEVYFVERLGKLKVFRTKTRTVDLLRTFEVHTGHEDGLLGVVVDPGFATNRWMYFMYSVKGQDLWRISRMTLSTDRKSLSDEKVVLEFPVQKKDCCHTGGGMEFDDLGDLWITIGNNEGRGTDGVSEADSIKSGEWGAGSTASLRGGVLRIRPTPDGKYAIPNGNFWEHFADKFEREGKPALAQSYRNPALVKRELYVKGSRNPYTLAIDPARRWVGYGDVGPDGKKPDSTGIGEEYNLHLAPAFGGWPYFAGNNRRNALAGADQDPAAPVNDSRWNKGVQQLPPAEPPLWEEKNGSSVAGPIYRYNSALQSPAKFPPHFHRLWFWNSWSTSAMRVVKLGDDGKLAPGWTGPRQVFKNHKFANAIEVKEGPDGALYVINYAGFFNSTAETRIERIFYKGPACQASIPWEKAGCKALDASITHNVPEACPVGLADRHLAAADSPLRQGPVVLGGHARLFVPSGIRKLELFDLEGRRILSRENPVQGTWLELPPGLRAGVYTVRMNP